MLKTIINAGDLTGKRVFLRTDFNVPMDNGIITNENRIVESLATIKLLQQKGAKIIIASHLGRPNIPSLETSLKPVKQVLTNLLQVEVKLSPEVVGTKTTELADNLKDGEILLLENLRWNSGEEAGDERFARELSSLADLFINDAFAVSHRAHASVYTITKYLPSYAGLLLEKEINSLSILLANPPRPMVIIIGGAKIGDKIGLIENLVDNADSFLIGGAMANTFLAAQGIDISESLVESNMISKAAELIKKYPDKLILPIDQVTEAVETGFKIMDIGEKTKRRFVEIIRYAKTVFWNGSLGYAEDEKYSLGTNQIALAVQQNRNCYSVVAGGDTVAAIEKAGFKDHFSFVSTGGGAALEFLTGKDLPGIKVLSF